MNTLNNLEKCPFCKGNKLKFDSKTGKDGYKHGIRFCRYTGSIRCNICHARGPTVSIEIESSRYANITYALDELMAKASDAWNTRK